MSVSPVMDLSQANVLIASKRRPLRSPRRARGLAFYEGFWEEALSSNSHVFCLGWRPQRMTVCRFILRALQVGLVQIGNDDARRCTQGGYSDQSHASRAD